MLTQVRRVGQHAALYALTRQELLAEMLESADGGSQFTIDILSNEFGLGESVKGRAHLLASIAVNPASLVWGYAEMLSQQVGPNPKAQRIRDFGTQHNLAQLTTDESHYALAEGQDQVQVITDLSHDVGMLGVEVFGPDVLYYSFPTGKAGSRAVVLVEELTTPVRRLELADVMVRIPRLVQQVDDLDWSLEGLAHLAGWRLERTQEPTQTTQGYRLSDAAGASFGMDVTRDELARITNISIKGINQP